MSSPAFPQVPDRFLATATHFQPVAAPRAVNYPATITDIPSSQEWGSIGRRAPFRRLRIPALYKNPDRSGSEGGGKDRRSSFRVPTRLHTTSLVTLKDHEVSGEGQDSMSLTSAPAWIAHDDDQ